MGVVHDLGLEENLGGVVHDLVAQLGLGDVLSELLDASSASLGRTILVNDLVALSLGGLTVSAKPGNKLLDDLELSSEESILGGVHLVSVHHEERQVHAGHSLHQTFIRGGQLELFEHTGGHTGGGCSGETDLVVENDGRGDGGPHQGVTQSVKIFLQGRGGVTDGNSHVNQSWKLLLQTLHHVVEWNYGLHLHLGLLLVHVDVLQFVPIVLHLALTTSNELHLTLPC